jgi:hypothetical protein
VDLVDTALAQKDFPLALHWLGQVQEYTGPLLRRFLVYLCAVAGYLILSPGRQKKDLVTAAQIYGAIESLSERSGIILGAFYQDKKSERIVLAWMHLSRREWEKAFQDGQHLSRDEVINLAKRELEKYHSTKND